MIRDDIEFGWRERLAIWVSWRLPRRVVYWAACRLMAHAGSARPTTEMDRLTPAECLHLWNSK